MTLKIQYPADKVGWEKSMYATANDAYLESRVLSAEPIELVRMLYQAAIDAVRNARRHLQAGDIAARSNSINKACAILAELQSSLDHERGAELASRLDSLYDRGAGPAVQPVRGVGRSGQDPESGRRHRAPLAATDPPGCRYGLRPSGMEFLTPLDVRSV
jgi:flagellar biosynthetic protein FliS